MNFQYHRRVLQTSSLAATACAIMRASPHVSALVTALFFLCLHLVFFSRTISLRNAWQTRMHFSFFVTERFARVLLARLLTRATRKESRKLTKKHAAMGGCIQLKCLASPPETGFGGAKEPSLREATNPNF